ncbi:SDR family NAD(P)-dependent oxidoreductase [Pseudoxanthomonas sp. PXM01]|uniref:SDR family NAD(P)-dependent oxidoreductase n=1 Tax=Pseudoxanthomonas sp. PXM01 TaxID=2769295 RepID=UPI00177EAF67|nr:SDR family NAD(P)-dependent oxidoreductase [Pseudoxanthomonas sp. PXM01]MBD9469629.1 SDR family NAD(P)-dependent oxidoreductase [Pseudoxanthomonas sp. PXM01]
MSIDNNLQQPLGTGFGPATTADEVAAGIDLSGTTAIITGGASGLGREAARVLASRGAHVIVPARDEQAAAAALAAVPSAEVMPMDLLDRASIDAFAKTFLARRSPLQRLVLSAGIMAPPLFRDADGHEGQFSTNHLGHFRLVCRLWPALAAAGGARVVVLSSRGHMLGDIDFDDVDYRERPYDAMQAYGQSKTANSLFAVALDKRGRDLGVHAYAVHPGAILGNLAKHFSREDIEAYGAIHPDGSPVIDPARDLKNVAQGAATTVWCATAPALEGQGGVYCEDCDIAPVEPERLRGVRAYAVDTSRAERLWQLSARLEGIDLPDA